jgi:hypothetical protein
MNQGKEKRKSEVVIAAKNRLKFKTLKNKW